MFLTIDSLSYAYSHETSGNGWCTPKYNTPECSFDGGDCLDFKEKYTGCDVPFPSLLVSEMIQNWLGYIG